MGPRNCDAVERAIRQYVETKSGFGNESRKQRFLEKTFQEFDRDGSGRIDEEEFLAGMVKLNIVGCTEDCLDLFDKIDQDMSGTISYAEFAKTLFPVNNSIRTDTESKGEPQSRGAPANRVAREAGDVVGRVKTRVLELAGKNSGIRGVTRILRQMDTDGSLSLSATELREGLLGYGVTINAAETRTLMAYFDRDGSGKITIEEFLRGLRGDMGRMRRKLVRSAWEQLVSHLEMDGPEDVITLRELSSFYDVSKNPLVIDGTLTPEEALRIFISHWDKDHDDCVTWKEFLDYYGDISAGIERDDYFELMIRNAWHLSGGAGWSENTSNIRCLVTFTNGEQKVVELLNDFGVQRSISTPQLIEILRKQGVKDVAEASITSK